MAKQNLWAPLCMWVVQWLFTLTMLHVLKLNTCIEGALMLFGSCLFYLSALFFFLGRISSHALQYLRWIEPSFFIQVGNMTYLHILIQFWLQAHVLRKYWVELSLIAIMLLQGTMKSILVALFFEPNAFTWRIKWDIKLLNIPIFGVQFYSNSFVFVLHSL